MARISQNKKVAIAAISIFFISLSLLLIFFDRQGENMDFGHTDVLSAEDSGHEDSIVIEEEGLPFELYKNYLENSSEPWLVTDSSGNIQYSSREFCELLAIEADEAENSLLFDYINAEDLSEMVSINTKIIQGAEKIERFGPYRMLNGDGEVLVLFTAYPVLNEDDMVEEIIYSIHDITEQAEGLSDGKDEDHEDAKSAYPRIQDSEDSSEIRLMVDRISYNPND